ncbi:hypothetical protein [Polaribacter sp. Hel1_85]|uniref:hypothetical protein n=1 Tax=Polaribacter sp. Hel1_85 TaxID=1250005 RepID=UPI00052BF1B0|nr:hypothetical protein [Polaribacter sp. Hel1_85]KGL62334.1 hypothetical protein PHEL85_2128 [Polaribacter sp. Hel1_85]
MKKNKDLKSKTLIAKQDKSEKDKLEDILDQIIRLGSIQCKRSEIAKSAALTLLGVGALQGVEYLIYRKNQACK